MEISALDPGMSDLEYPSADPLVSATPQAKKELEALATGSKGDSLRQIVRKPFTIVALALGFAIIGIVLFLQRDPSLLRLEAPDAQYELLQNQGLTPGLPIAIRLGPLALFEISDPMAGGAGATRARRVVANLNSAVAELEETPGRVITIETGASGQSYKIVQKAKSDSVESHEIVRITSDDLVLAQTDDAKLLARIWAERLTDSLRLLLFGEPPEFSRQSTFGSALDTLYVNARSQSGGLTTEALRLAFEELPEASRQALTTFTSLLPKLDDTTSAEPGDVLASRK